MNDILRMAREAGGYPAAATDRALLLFSESHLERFAALVRDYLLSTEIHSCHANCERFACVQTRKAVEAEREACAKDCDLRGEFHAAAAIRARGQH
jgi:hypothetical protein